MSMFCLSVTHIPKTKTLRAVILLAVALGAGSLFAEGQVFWQDGGVVVCDSTASGGQAAVSDDSGGVFVVWCDRRGENGSIWAQHLDRDGNAVWQQNGEFVRDGNRRGINQISALSDGRGGLVAVWQESDELVPHDRHQVTAQRLDASGTVLWDSGGVVVTGADSGFTYEVAAVSDGSGGAIVGWTVVAWDSTGVDSLVVQRIDSLGNLCWGDPGLVMATKYVELEPPEICSDGAGGACIAWHVSGWNGYPVAQHVDSDGRTTWPGVGVSLLPPGWFLRRMTRLSAGYMIAGMMVDSMNAQRIDDQGQLLWGPDGCPVYRHGTPRRTHVFHGPDSSSYVVWTEERAGDIGMYAQLLNASGERQWDSLGVEVGSTNDNESSLFGCVPAGAGFIVSWPYNSGGPTDWDTYAQHVDTAGRLLWGDPGLGIATDSGRQMWTPCVVTDKRQGAIIVWGNVYYPSVRVVLTAQRVGDVVGVAGPVSTTRPQIAIPSRPSPARSAVEVYLQRPSESVNIADALGRVVRVLPVPRGETRATWDLRDVKGTRVPAGVYVFRQHGSGTMLGRVVVVNP